MNRFLLSPPQLRVGEAAENQPRHATWLELFYDLVFVVAVSQLAHELGQHITVAGFLGFVALFIPVWWAWIGTTFYANRFDSDNVVRRVLMGLQMLAIAALAVNVHHGLGESSTGFALSYAAARCVLVLEYLWAGWCIPVARGLTTRYSTGFAIAAALWLISTAVPIPWRFVFWGVGLVVDFATPFTALQFQRQLPPHTEHLPERFGLFTIIVLGEAIIAVVNGVSEVEWTLMNGLTTVFGFVMAFCLWWLYFENVSGTALNQLRSSGKLFWAQVWLYVHLPLVIGLAAAGVGVERMIVSQDAVALPTPERWLICGSVALYYLALSILHRSGIIYFCKARTKHRWVATVILLVLAIAGDSLLPITVMGLIALISIVQVMLDLYQGRAIAPSPSLATSE